jgi:GAF domain-containing protein
MKDMGDPHEVRRLEVLEETGLVAAPSLPELDRLCREARLRFDTPMAFVTVVNRDSQIVKAGLDMAVPALPRSVAFCHHTIQSDEVLVVPDAAEDPRFVGNPFVVGPPHLRFYAGAPLVYLPGIRLGSFCLADVAPRNLDSRERVELAAMARQASSLIARWEFESWFR